MLFNLNSHQTVNDDCKIIVNRLTVSVFKRAHSHITHSRTNRLLRKLIFTQTRIITHNLYASYTTTHFFQNRRYRTFMREKKTDMKIKMNVHLLNPAKIKPDSDRCHIHATDLRNYVWCKIKRKID